MGGRGSYEGPSDGARLVMWPGPRYGAPGRDVVAEGALRVTQPKYSRPDTCRPLCYTLAKIMPGRVSGRKRWAMIEFFGLVFRVNLAGKHDRQDGDRVFRHDGWHSPQSASIDHPKQGRLLSLLDSLPMNGIWALRNEHFATSYDIVTLTFYYTENIVWFIQKLK